MASLSSQCPECNARLKLPSREAVGKTATCPQCRAKFVVPPPSEPLQGETAASREPSARDSAAAPNRATPPRRKPASAPSPAPSASSPPARPPKRRSSSGDVPVTVVDVPWGLQARWVPDAVSPVAATANPPSVPGVEEVPHAAPVETPGEREAAAAPLPPRRQAARETGGSQPSNASSGSETPTDVSDFDESPDESTATTESERDASEAAIQPRSSRRSRRSRSSGRAALIGGGVLVVAGLAALPLFLSDPPPTPQQTSTTAEPPGGRQPAAVPVAAAAAPVSIESPTRGQPIDAQLLPDGVSVLLHLRPAEWQSGPGRDLRNALPASVVAQAEAWLEKASRHPVGEINEATVGLVLGGRGSEPQIAAVFRLRREIDLGPWLQSLGGQIEIIDEPRRQVTLGDEVLFIKDLRTIAVGPASVAGEMRAAMDADNGFLNATLVDLLPVTDRLRSVTLLASQNDLRLHAASLLGEDGGTLVETALETLAEGQRGVGLSIHQGRETYIEWLGNPDASQTPATARSDLARRWERVPQELMERLRTTRPIGPVREIVGRVPAMAEAARLASRTDTTGKLARLRISLPPKAGPNLMVGTVLTFNTLAAGETLVAAAPKAEPAVVQPLQQRLERTVLASFNRVPIEQVFSFLAEEAGATYELDGGAFEDAGYTRNESLTFDLGETTIRNVLADFVRRYDKIAFVADESTNRLLVTTKKFAEQNGQTPLSFE